MSDAIRLDTDVAHWAPESRHYQIDGGHVVVTKHCFLTATGTDVYYCDDRAAPFSMEPIASFPDGTTHDGALEALGYTVIDTVGETVAAAAVEDSPAAEPAPPTVFDLLPPEIAAVIAAATTTEETPT